MKFIVYGFVGLAALTAQAALDVAVGVGDELPIVAPSEAVARLKAEISSDAAVGQISFTARNVLGGETSTQRILSFKDGKASVPVLDAPLLKGAYDIVWLCKAGGDVAAGTNRIAVCDDMGPSQGMDGEFLFGTHAHLQCCRDRREEELEVRAAARAGFKVMRIDLAWREMEKAHGTLDWSIGEWRVGLLEKYGIMPQVLVGLAPDWAVKKDWVLERPDRGQCGNKLPEHGFWRQFLEKMAAHFGARIPFYELYNEPDLIGFGNFSVDEYVASFNEGARGIRAGFPSAKVLTGGIACWRKTIDTKKDFLPRGVLGTAEDFDILAIHEHGGGFFRSLDDNWLPLLKKNNIRKPIWPNETSEDARRGEAAQAAAYMQKALFSWSRGCCAHNWYKIRDSRCNLSETRRFYGLFSRDFEPLAAYPAVAGTVSVYRNARFVREIPNEDMELLLFRRKDALVLAGWPHNPGAAACPRPVKVRTDAKKAFFVDLMGNARAVSIDAGEVTFDVGRFIGSMVLCGAGSAEVIANPPLPRPKPLSIPVPNGSRPAVPQLTFDRDVQYTSLAGYNPATEHLRWQGPADISARCSLWLEGGALNMEVESTDDVAQNSDVVGVALAVDGQRRYFAWVRSSDGRAYSHKIPLDGLWLAPGKKVLCNILVRDADEGDVVEGHMRISDDLDGRRLGEWAELKFQ